jgi:FkbM family methyltransferase
VRVLSGGLKGARWIAGAGNNAYWLGTYEPARQGLFSKLVKPNGVVYDIGAHVGFYSLLASRTAGSVFAFEPFPRNLEYLRKHVELNDVSNITIIDAAVSDNDGNVTFSTDSNSYGNHLSEHGMTVRCVSLDSLDLPPPELIKCDVEGAEFLVLSGAHNLLIKHHPILIVDLHGHEMKDKCSELLLSIGYDIQILYEGVDECLIGFAVL